MSELTCRMRINSREVHGDNAELCGRETCAKVEMEFEGEMVHLPMCRPHAEQMQRRAENNGWTDYVVRFEE